MSDDLERRASQARDNVRREAERAAETLPPVGVLRDRANRRRTARRGVALTGVLAVGILAMTVAAGEGKDRSAVTVSTPDSPQPGSLPADMPSTTLGGSPGTTTATRPRSTTTTSAGAATPTTARAEGAHDGLWVVGVDGKGLRQVVDSRDAAYAGSGIGLAVWSPDGRSLAVPSTDGIRIVSVADGHVAQTIPLSGNQSGVSCLDWSVQDRLAWLATSGDFSHQAGSAKFPDHREVWVAGVHDSQAQMIDTVPFDMNARQAPGPLCSWSPNGSKLAVGGQDLRLYSADGSTISTTALDPTLWTIGSLAWSPDGAAVAGVAPTRQGASDHVFVKSLTAGLRLWPAPIGGEIARFFWAPDRSGPYLRVVAASSGSSAEPGAGIYSFDVEDGSSTLLTHNAVIGALDALSDRRFIGLTSDSATADTVGVFGSNGELQSVVTRADTRLPADRLCPGSYFSALQLSPLGDHLLLQASRRVSSGRQCDYVGPS